MELMKHPPRILPLSSKINTKGESQNFRHFEVAGINGQIFQFIHSLKSIFTAIQLCYEETHVNGVQFLGEILDPPFLTRNRQKLEYLNIFELNGLRSQGQWTP